ncbi:conserved hypothetical protein [Nitrobacter hamburgensis X14]|uniref:Bacteriophage CI repressor N-terminal domain-containing protein n=1 Tax=Nitrobacter hamburgensis (strain DSM 10229 / NCIMB 13809 / X14) TaxID=323097 RepID=Q1QMW3_NITHX|nr:helix-turn-helix domain-containing protein [Nitrobacter hamburgensis]ABE62434.1 conserved hypothetical protein [Nitrobacter hamburgensis X14]
MSTYASSNDPADARFGARAVIDRLKEVFGVSSDAALADELRTARANISKWKARNSVPYAEAVYASISKGISLDYLLAGSGSVASSRLPSNLDPEFIRAALQLIVRAGLLSIGKGHKPAETLEAAASSISVQYERAEKAMYELVVHRGLSGVDARKAAIVAIEMLDAELAARQQR